jgi:hypothetical protein
MLICSSLGISQAMMPSPYGPMIQKMDVELTRAFAAFLEGKISGDEAADLAAYTSLDT